MIYYDLYGFASLDIEQVRKEVEESLSISMVGRQSDYHGLYYFYGDKTKESLILKNNVDPTDGEPAELKFAQTPVLLYVNRSERSDLIRRLLEEKMAACSRLRHEIAADSPSVSSIDRT